MGFTINVWNLYALAHCNHRCHLPFYPSNWLVAVCTDVSEFIHPHTNSTALQEKLHECFGWFITSSIGVSSTTTCDIPLYPTISK